MFSVINNPDCLRKVGNTYMGIDTRCEVIGHNNNM